MNYLPSVEQQIIIDNFKSGKNIIVNSVAGSGKTSTMLFCCQNVQNINSKSKSTSTSTSNVLIVTYNARLKLETRKKIKELELKNVECHSYHALVTKYYSCSQNDLQLKNILKNDLKIKRLLIADYIMIDEAQDMSLDYFNLIYKILKDSNS